MIAGERQAQLDWEARFAPMAAGAAWGAVVLQIAGFAASAAAVQDGPDADDPDRHIASLDNIQDHFGEILASAILQGLSLVLTAAALFYLFRATRHRRPELPSVLRWLLVIAPILVLVGGVLDRVDIKDIADRYTSQPALAEPTSDQTRDARTECRDDLREDRAQFNEDFANFDRCVEVTAKDNTAEDYAEDQRGLVGGTLALAGGLAMGFALVLVSLHAMRAGLLSRFMGILGIIAGVLQVLPLAPIPVVHIFWLGALGALFLNRWPSGRGPAWASGTAEPWPTAAEQREEMLAAAGDRADAEPADPEPADEEMRPQHPTSKKRKRKRRR